MINEINFVETGNTLCQVMKTELNNSRNLLLMMNYELFIFPTKTFLFHFKI